MRDDAGGVEIGHELRQPAGELELVGLAVALVVERDGQTTVEIAQLAQALRQHLEAELGSALEDRGVGFEGDLRARLLRDPDLF